MKLKQIMQQAVDDDLLAKNPCAKISVPRPEPKEREALSVEEAAHLLGCLLEEKPIAHSLFVRRDEDDKEKITELEVVFMDPNNYSRWFRNWCVEHDFGTFENVTLDIYSHAIAANDRAASDAFSKLIAPKPEDV